MNSKKSYIILLAVLAAVIIGASAGYRAYTDRPQESKNTGQAAEASEALSEDKTEPGDTVPVDGTASVSMDDESSSASSSEIVPEDPSASSGSSGEYPDAEDFTVVTPEGMKASLSELKGKPVIVNFWASWCPPCKAELPYFQEAYDEYGGRITFMMVDLNDGYRETDAAVQNFLKETGYSFPVFYDRDGSASNTYEIYSIPVTLGIDAEGKLIYQRTGSLMEQELDELVASLLGDQE